MLYFLVKKLNSYCSFYLNLFSLLNKIINFYTGGCFEKKVFFQLFLLFYCFLAPTLQLVLIRHLVSQKKLQYGGHGIGVLGMTKMFLLATTLLFGQTYKESILMQLNFGRVTGGRARLNVIGGMVLVLGICLKQ